MSVLKWTLIWLLIFGVLIGGALWYGMSQVVESDLLGVPVR